MITQTTGMNVGWLEIMTQSKHWQQWSVTCLITEIVLKLTASQLRTALWLCSNKFSMALASKVMTEEWEGNTTEVTTATETSNHLIRILTCHRHLLLCLKTDDGLVKCHMIEHRTQRILTARCGCSQLNSLTDGCTERTRMMRIACNDILTRTSTHRRRTLYSGSKRTHDARTVWFLLHGNLYLVNRSLQTVELSCIRKGCTPLTCTSLCCDIGITLLLTIVALRNSRIDFMRT